MTRFGRYPKDINPKVWWGARAIFGKGTDFKLDIPYDRKSYEGEKDDDFLYWINNSFFAWLLKRVNENLYNSQDTVYSFESEGGRFYGEVSCQNSQGYLYIGCWETTNPNK